MSFKPMYDLESLTEVQRQEYYLAACEHYRVPPELNLLAFMYMDAGDGKRNLVLYAKKGATDLMREQHGISTTKITKDGGPGYVAWIVEGRNAKGRTEMAVGSASIEGLKGQQLANAVMIAHTRANRRLTLQFVGGGLLDESELNETTTDINRALMPLSAMATLPAPVQPIVSANTEAGKDVTQQATFVNGWTATPEQSKAAGFKPSMAVPAPFSGGDITPKTLETLESFTKYPNMSELAKTITDPVVLAAVEAVFKPEEPRKRRRRTKAEMAQAAANIVFDAVTAQDPEAIKIIEFANQIMSPNADIPESQQTPTLVPGQIGQATNQVIDQVVEQAAAELMPDYPTKEQEAGYRERLGVYTKDVLKAGGMTDGIIWRVRKYTMSMFPEAVIENGKLKLTCKQWDALLEDFHNKQHQLGPQALVAAINVIAEKA
jgi:hypothetical protein